MMSLSLGLVLQASMIATGDPSYIDAYRMTAETGRPLVVLIGAEWCPACRTMKNSVMPQLEKQGGLGKVSFAYVNTDHQSALAQQLMRGGSIPQLVMYSKTPTGWSRQQLTGAHSVGEIQSFLGRATEQPVAALSSRE